MTLKILPADEPKKYTGSPKSFLVYDADLEILASREKFMVAKFRYEVERFFDHLEEKLGAKGFYSGTQWTEAEKKMLWGKREGKLKLNRIGE